MGIFIFEILRYDSDYGSLAYGKSSSIFALWLEKSLCMFYPEILGDINEN